MIQFKLSGQTEVTAYLKSRKPKLLAAVEQKMWDIVVSLQAAIKGKLHGPVLAQRSGRLARSIVADVIVTKSSIRGIVGVSKTEGAQKYAAAQEYGANIPERVPVNVEALHWQAASGEDVFAKRAKAFKLPSRSYMRSTFTEQRPRILEQLDELLKTEAV